MTSSLVSSTRLLYVDSGRIVDDLYARCLFFLAFPLVEGSGEKQE